MITRRLGIILNEKKSDWTPFQFPVDLVLDLFLTLAYTLYDCIEIGWDAWSSGESLEVSLQPPGQPDPAGAKGPTHHISPLQYRSVGTIQCRTHGRSSNGGSIQPTSRARYLPRTRSWRWCITLETWWLLASSQRSGQRPHRRIVQGGTTVPRSGSYNNRYSGLWSKCRIGRLLTCLRWQRTPSSQCTTVWEWISKSSGTHTLTINRDLIQGYEYPPIVLLPWVLRKLLRHLTVTIILIAPILPSQIWVKQLTNLLVNVPRRLNAIGTSWGAGQGWLHGNYPQINQGFSESLADTASKGCCESIRRVYGACASNANWCAAWAGDLYAWIAVPYKGQWLYVGSWLKTIIYLWFIISWEFLQENW